eukprot:11070082-Karenia_brevis.AAC.1
MLKVQNDGYKIGPRGQRKMTKDGAKMGQDRSKTGNRPHLGRHRGQAPSKDPPENIAKRVSPRGPCDKRGDSLQQAIHKPQTHSRGQCNTPLVPQGHGGGYSYICVYPC